MRMNQAEWINLNCMRIILIGLLACIFTVSALGKQPQPFCQILDQQDDLIWHVRGGYAEGGKVAGGANLRMLESGGGAGLFYSRTAVGEFDLRFKADATTFVERGDLRMPDQVAAVRLDLDYVARLQDGYALRVGIAPGFYSQITHVNMDHFYYPFLLHGLYAFNPEVTGVFGFNVYPGFDRVLEPRVGVRWGISDFLLLDLFYPATEVVFRPTVGWALRAGVDFKRKTQYRLKRSDDRHSLIMKETRMYLGLDHMISPQMRFMFRIGRIVDRDLDFRRGTPARGIDDSGYIQIGIGGVI